MFGQLSLAAIVVSSALSAALAGAAAWKYQAHRYQAEKAELYASAQTALRVQENRYAELVRKATDSAKARERAARVDAARAADAAERLRDALAAATAAAASSPTACPERVVAYDDVLRDMERAGRAMAEACDRHVNDIRTLTEAWPK